VYVCVCVCAVAPLPLCHCQVYLMVNTKPTVRSLAKAKAGEKGSSDAAGDAGVAPRTPYVVV